MTAIRQESVLDSPIFTGNPQAPTPTIGDADTSIATTGFVTNAVAAGGGSGPRGFVMGKGGPVLTTDTNAADYPILVPYNCTLLRMKVTLKVAASGAMVVKLRKAAGPITITPTYVDVTGFSVTFSNGNVAAAADPADVDVSEGDMMNFSCTTGSGSNILVEVVVALR